MVRVHSGLPFQSLLHFLPVIPYLCLVFSDHLLWHLVERSLVGMNSY
jgi:hypothetical protein